ncbi:hypothetical protein [Pseudomonas tumuqii]|uniref:hypothetical protein n=1 Tax=Pseudomonas tumuqii TaxID=2715755 RepID=UPI0015565F57|nr:hypothetical protein [Pseudomonas tumuqii]
MFNLLVKAGGWEGRHDSMPKGRMLTWTDEAIVQMFSQGHAPDLQRLIKLPALFADETNHHRAPQFARVGWISTAGVRGSDIQIEYTFDPDIPAIPQEMLTQMGPQLHIDLRSRGITELEQTHWAVKEVDLFKVLLTNLRPTRPSPTAFTLPDPHRVDPLQVSAMMPFSPLFTRVYDAIQLAAEAAGKRCTRVDVIWENHAVIQDVISLIDRSAFVVCDCTGQNPNVFYEIGIAHTLGKEVILITQNPDDVPFDLRHIRYLTYLNNGEGLAVLQTSLAARLRNSILR